MKTTDIVVVIGILSATEKGNRIYNFLLLKIKKNFVIRLSFKSKFIES